MACNNQTGNAGNLYCKDGSNFLKPNGIIFAPNSFSQSAADFLLEAQHIAAIKAGNMFPIMEMKNFEENSTEVTYHEYANEDRKLTSQGKYRFTAYYDMNECQKKELLKFRNFNGKVYFTYSNNVIRGRSADGGVNVEGMRLSEVNIRKATFPLMDGTPEMIAIDFSLVDEIDANELDYSREMTWDITELDSLTPVTLAQVGTATASAAVISVSGTCNGNDYPISGLETADFVNSGAGTGLAYVDNGDGTYAITGTGMDDTTTIGLVAPSALSSDLLIVTATLGAVTLVI